MKGHTRMTHEDACHRSETSFTCHSPSLKRTESLARKLASSLVAGDVLSLDGDLGAGKTAFTRGLAAGLGLESDVSSPTFTLLIEHDASRTGLALHHFDAYRLQGGEDFCELGLDEYFDREGVSVIEWGSRIRNVLPKRTLFIGFYRDDPKHPSHRRIEFSWPQEPDRLQALKAALIAAGEALR